MDLFIWGNAEVDVTIIAASIPVLRVFAREIRTSARRYYISHVGGDPEETAARGAKTTADFCGAAITATL